MPTYRSIVKKSLRITLKNKKLLILGFFLALLGNGGEYEVLIKNIRFAADNTWLSAFNTFFAHNVIVHKFLFSLKHIFFAQQPLMSFALFIALGGLIYLMVIAEGSIIDAIYHTTAKRSAVNLKQSWLRTRKKFWELLFTNIIFKGGGLLIAFTVAAPIFFALTTLTPLGTPASALFTTILIFTPLAIVLAFLVKYTLLFIIVKDRSPLVAFFMSIKLFQKYWLITLENALLLFVINIVLGILTFVVAVMVSFPIIAALGLINYPHALPEGHYATIIAWFNIFFILVLGSFLAVFQYTTWTVLFTKLTGQSKITSKLVRLFTRRR